MFAGRKGKAISQSSCQRAKCKLVYNFSASAAELNGIAAKRLLEETARDPSSLRSIRMATDDKPRSRDACLNELSF